MIKNKKVVQGEKTVQRLLKVARKHFKNKGYSATTTEDIIQDAKVTKGALYHHFPSKVDLFEAVYRKVEDEMGQRIQDSSANRRDRFEQLLEGCRTYLECCIDDDLHRILRMDGPSVLGMNRWQEIDREYGVDRLLPFLYELKKEGVIDVQSVEAFATLLTGALNEATFWCSGHKNPPQALKQSKSVLETLLRSVQVTQ